MTETPKCAECGRHPRDADCCAHVVCPCRRPITAQPRGADPRPVKLGVPDIGEWFFDKQD